MKNEKISKAILADRDTLYMRKLKSFLEENNVEVIATTDSGDKALSMTQALQPDILLMDVLLTEKDGFWVLENLKQSTNNKTVCIMISAMSNDKIVLQAMTLGADYFMAKPIQPEVLLERMGQLTTQYIPENPPVEVKENTSTQGETMQQLEADISSLLNRMGISASIKGYHFIRKAVIMAVEDDEVLIGITKILYPDIGKAYKTTASKVERAIRHAIEVSWKKNGKDIFFEVSGYYSPQKPTNGQFIAAISEYFRLNLKNKHMRTA